MLPSSNAAAAIRPGLGAPEPFAALNKIPIRDNGESLLDLRQHAEFAILAPRCLPYVRESVAVMLRSAQIALGWKYRLIIGTALRTLDMQSRIYWRNYALLREEHPTWPASALRRTCNRSFAPPDAAAPPGHCTGGAVDVGLTDFMGRRLDLAAPFQFWDGARTFRDDLLPEAAHLRARLIEAMYGAGFTNCRDEWWHWSYGDSAWAVRVGYAAACYGPIDPPADYTHIPVRRRPRFAAHRRRRRAWG